ncbi:hypothetical protein ACP2YA_07620 [Staphylococcus epidermidis]|uniref:hypothetical protein n=1 Tax=Staphylococcus TaxID=1279 RepID=UPI00026C05B0|nr:MULTISPECIES: hypothetical protein [Staphylococcus]EJE13984.1 hypothetical protein HMPREF9978_11333 [Staphylococcus epidermidis NIHLM015]KAB2188825.1 hypothetical protein F9B33_07385 [Staphylococcus epidermidis]MBF8058022.1 hypothetical protein [Staphylococcus epidermidis]MBM6269031.1 hypothetical protein [Staphylococcus epidermidis]MBM6334490.1 hypothetical protein [Staphylococcus epidermidis]
MYFNDWKVTINGKGSHDVVTNEDTLLILQGYQHIEIALKLVDDTIQVKSLGYGEDISINPTTKEITVNVTNLLEDDE